MKDLNYPIYSFLSIDTSDIVTKTYLIMSRNCKQMNNPPPSYSLLIPITFTLTMSIPIKTKNK